MRDLSSLMSILLMLPVLLLSINHQKMSLINRKIPLVYQCSKMLLKEHNNVKQYVI